MEQTFATTEPYQNRLPTIAIDSVDERRSTGFVDYRFSSLQSVVLRYHGLNSLGLTAAELEQSSIREGARVLPFLNYRDVRIDLLDAVSLTATGTFKSIDACVVSAMAQRSGIKKCAVASGGNTGFARALYAERLGIETFWFIPAENQHLIPQQVRDYSKIHIFPVDNPGAVKQQCKEFIAANPDVCEIPTEWKVSAFETLGGFIAEHIIEHNDFDWIAQTVSAGFAPLAYCGVLNQLHSIGRLSLLPQFLGVQQHENCHMLKAWKNTQPQQPISSTNELLLPVIFDTEPHTYNTQERFFSLLDRHKGELNSISCSEFLNFEQSFVAEHKLFALLESHNISPQLEDGRICERAGFVALAGIVKAIDQGTILPGSRVLSVLSGA